VAIMKIIEELDDRKKIAGLNKVFKKEFEHITKIKITFGFHTASKKSNPYLAMSPKDEKDIIPNDFRANICKALNQKPLNWDDVEYGNISEKTISLVLSEWLKVAKYLNIKIDSNLIPSSLNKSN
jgi:hypothetical protein